MSRSYKKEVVKDPKPKSWYKRVRRTTKTVIASGREEEIPLERTIVNDYEICDHKWGSYIGRGKKDKKLSRK